MALSGPVQPSVAGLYLQVASTLCVSFMALVAKVAGHRGIPVMEIVLARSLVLLLLSTSMLARKGARAEWPWRSARWGGGHGRRAGAVLPLPPLCPATHKHNSLRLMPHFCTQNPDQQVLRLFAACRRGLLLVRGLLGFAAVSTLYWAVQLLPLGDTAVLTFLMPLFVAVGAPVVLGERAGRGVLLALPLCVAGVVLVAQPTFLFGQGAEALSALGVAVGISQASPSPNSASTFPMHWRPASPPSMHGPWRVVPCPYPTTTHTHPPLNHPRPPSTHHTHPPTTQTHTRRTTHSPPTPTHCCWAPASHCRPSSLRLPSSASAAWDLQTQWAASYLPWRQ